jgi:ribose 1,5-bisphosphokinase PhnN
VANGSRGIVSEARERFAPVRILLVTAAPATLAARIASRGRESGEAIAARLERARAEAPSGADVVTNENDGTLEQAVNRFVSALRLQPQTTVIS